MEYTHLPSQPHLAPCRFRGRSLLCACPPCILHRSLLRSLLKIIKIIKIIICATVTSISRPILANTQHLCLEHPLPMCVCVCVLHACIPPPLTPYPYHACMQVPVFQRAHVVDEQQLHRPHQPRAPAPQRQPNHSHSGGRTRPARVADNFRSERQQVRWLARSFWTTNTSHRGPATSCPLLLTAVYTSWRSKGGHCGSVSRLTAVPSSLKGLTQVHTIDLSGNAITYIRANDFGNLNVRQLPTFILL